MTTSITAYRNSGSPSLPSAITLPGALPLRSSPAGRGLGASHREGGPPQQDRGAAAAALAPAAAPPQGPHAQIRVGPAGACEAPPKRAITYGGAFAGVALRREVLPVFVVASLPLDIVVSRAVPPAMFPGVAAIQAARVWRPKDATARAQCGGTIPRPGRPRRVLGSHS